MGGGRTGKHYMTLFSPDSASRNHFFSWLKVDHDSNAVTELLILSNTLSWRAGLLFTNFLLSEKI